MIPWGRSWGVSWKQLGLNPGLQCPGAELISAKLQDLQVLAGTEFTEAVAQVAGSCRAFPLLHPKSSMSF